ncbi:hypothetical protein QBC34DRAFT_102368 [Podospora aff. communis PSN243]|uniref:Uncharacterized protein n=1 Tax=Podospora aff. communis PSN243 TaxID=3040156 RepID=A0AAV9GLE0_9PEZI|nr:hypothetical protein QBC34DRAFT_102368 [Podospora aff. communis PSN243]
MGEVMTNSMMSSGQTQVTPSSLLGRFPRRWLPSIGKWQEPMSDSDALPPTVTTSPSQDATQLGQPDPSKRAYRIPDRIRGEELYRYPHAKIELERWTDDDLQTRFNFVADELHDAMKSHPGLAGDIRFTSFTFEMVGVSAEKARPCIIVFCRKEPQFFAKLTACFEKRARKILYRDKKAPPVPPLRIVYYRIDYDPVSRKAADTMVLARHLNETTWCGSLVQFGARTATLGLTIQVGELVGVLTVDHLFSPESCEASADVEDVDMTEDEIHAMATDETSALWIDDAGDYLDTSEDDEPPTPEGSSYGVEAPMTLADASPASSGPLEMWERIIPPRELPRSEPYLDWSLTRMTNGSMLQHGNFILPEGEKHPIALTKFSTQARPDHRSVYIVSGMRGTLRGSLSAGSALLGSGPGRQLCEAWAVFLDSGSEILHGECGSLVVDQTTYEVYGHVVASGPDGLIYAVPLKNVLAQIEKSFAIEEISIFETTSTPLSSGQRGQRDLSSTLTTPTDPRELPVSAAMQNDGLGSDATKLPSSAEGPIAPPIQTTVEIASPLRRGAGEGAGRANTDTNDKGMGSTQSLEEVASSYDTQTGSITGISGPSIATLVDLASGEPSKQSPEVDGKTLTNTDRYGNSRDSAIRFIPGQRHRVKNSPEIKRWKRNIISAQQREACTITLGQYGE